MDKNVALAIRSDLDKALREIAQKYGVSQTRDQGRITAAEGMLEFKISLQAVEGVTTLPDATETPSFARPTDSDRFKKKLDQAAEALEHMAKLHGISTKPNARGERLIGYNPRGKTMPWFYEGARGGRWKTTTAKARLMFGTTN